jgi:hypothetical protein
LVEVVGERIFGEVEGGLADLPRLKAGFSPAFEVLAFYGLAFEFGFEDFLDLGEGVEPVDDWFLLLRLIESAIYFFANFAREAGDFAFLHKC